MLKLASNNVEQQHLSLTIEGL